MFKRATIKKLNPSLLPCKLQGALGESDKGSVRLHDTGSTSVECNHSANHAHGASSFVETHAGDRVHSSEEVGDRKQQEGQSQGGEDSDSWRAGLQRCNQKHEC